MTASRAGMENCENIVKIWGDRWSSSHEVSYMWLRCGKIKQKSKKCKTLTWDGRLLGGSDNAKNEEAKHV